MWRRTIYFLALPSVLVLLLCVQEFIALFFELDPAGQEHHILARGQKCEVSPLLGKLLIVVSYHWDVTKLIYLAALLDTIRTYETRVHVVIVTDHERALYRTLQKWEHFDYSTLTLQIWQAPSTNDTNKHALLWAHRQAIEEQLEHHPNFTSIIYMEDDTRLSWPAVVSWALDTEVLAPLNFTRCIYRTEVDVETGGGNMLDWSSPLQLDYSNTLNVTYNADYARVQDRLQKASDCRCGKHRDGTLWPCRVHAYYLTPAAPFQGMWIASREQLLSFMAHPYWKKEDALKANLAYGMGYPERTTFMILAVNVPAGYQSSCMVPFVFSDKETGLSLPAVAEVEHMRNGYSSTPGIHLARLHVKAAIQGAFKSPPIEDTASTLPPMGKSTKFMAEHVHNTILH